jgi:hypothetical protein
MNKVLAVWGCRHRDVPLVFDNLIFDFAFGNATRFSLTKMSVSQSARPSRRQGQLTRPLAEPDWGIGCYS